MIAAASWPSGPGSARTARPGIRSKSISQTAGKHGRRGGYAGGGGRGATKLAAVSSEEGVRIGSGIRELDRVLGGVVPHRRPDRRRSRYRQVDPVAAGAGRPDGALEMHLRQRRRIAAADQHACPAAVTGRGRTALPDRNQHRGDPRRPGRGKAGVGGHGFDPDVVFRRPAFGAPVPLPRCGKPRRGWCGPLMPLTNCGP